jgi:hypothetical protein
MTPFWFWKLKFSGILGKLEKLDNIRAGASNLWLSKDFLQPKLDSEFKIVSNYQTIMGKN